MLTNLTFYGYKRRDPSRPQDFDAILLRAADGNIVQLSPVPLPPPVASARAPQSSPEKPSLPPSGPPVPTGSKGPRHPLPPPPPNRAHPKQPPAAAPVAKKSLPPPSTASSPPSSTIATGAVLANEEFADLPQHVKLTYVLSSSSSAWSDSESEEELEGAVTGGGEAVADDGAEHEEGSNRSSSSAHSPTSSPQRPPPPPALSPTLSSPEKAATLRAPAPPPPPPLPVHGRVVALHPSYLCHRALEALMVQASTPPPEGALTRHPAAPSAAPVAGKIVPPALRVLVVLGYDKEDKVYLQSFQPSNQRDRSTVVVLPAHPAAQTESTAAATGGLSPSSERADDAEMPANLWAPSMSSETPEPAVFGDITDMFLSQTFTDCPPSTLQAGASTPASSTSAPPLARRFVQAPVLGNLSTMAVLLSPPLQRAPLADTFHVRPEHVYLFERKGGRTARFVGVGWDGAPWISYMTPAEVAAAAAAEEHKSRESSPPLSGNAPPAPPPLPAPVVYRAFADPLPGCFSEDQLISLCGLCDPLDALPADVRATTAEEDVIGPTPPGYVPREVIRSAKRGSTENTEHTAARSMEERSLLEKVVEDSTTVLPHPPPPLPGTAGSEPQDTTTTEVSRPRKSGENSTSTVCSSTTSNLFVRKGNRVTVPGPFGVLCECDAHPEVLAQRYGVAHGDRLRERPQEPRTAEESDDKDDGAHGGGGGDAVVREGTVMGVCAGSLVVLFDNDDQATVLRGVKPNPASVANLFVKVAGLRLSPPALPIEQEDDVDEEADEAAEDEEEIVEFDDAAEAALDAKLAEFAGQEKDQEEDAEQVLQHQSQPHGAKEINGSAPTPSLLSPDACLALASGSGSSPNVSPIANGHAEDKKPPDPHDDTKEDSQDVSGDTTGGPSGPFGARVSVVPPPASHPEVVIDYNRQEPSLAPTSLAREEPVDVGGDDTGASGAEDAPDAAVAPAEEKEDGDRSETASTPEEADRTHDFREHGPGARLVSNPNSGSQDGTAVSGTPSVSPSIAMPSAQERPIVYVKEALVPPSAQTAAHLHGSIPAPVDTATEDEEEEETSTDATPSHLPSLSFPRHDGHNDGGHARDTEAHFWSRPGAAGSASMPAVGTQHAGEHTTTTVHPTTQASSQQQHRPGHTHTAPPLPKHRSGFTDFLKAYSIYMQDKERREASRAIDKGGNAAGEDAERPSDPSLAYLGEGITVDYIQRYYATNALAKMMAAQRALRACRALWKAIARNLKGTRVLLNKNTPPGMHAEEGYTDFEHLCVDEVVEFLRANEDFIFGDMQQAC